MTYSEKNYAEIDKELLAIIFACEKFATYIYGKSTVVQSDHKPLEAIFRKSVNQVSPRLQKMLLRLLTFELVVQYIPGNSVLIADTLSRAFVDTVDESSLELADDIEATVHTLLNDFPASYNRHEQFRQQTNTESTLTIVYFVVTYKEFRQTDRICHWS